MSDLPPTVPPATPPPPGSGSYTPPPPPPPPIGGGGPGPGPSQSSDRGIMLFLSYFGIFALIPLLTKKDDPEVQWHAKNGLGLAIVMVGAWIAMLIVGVILGMVSAALAIAWNGLACVIYCILLIVDIVAMVKAFGGQRMVIPVATDLGQKLNF